LKIFQRRLVRSGARHKVSALDSADIRQLKNTLQLGLIQTAKLKNPAWLEASSIPPLLRHGVTSCPVLAGAAASQGAGPFNEQIAYLQL
jgi:hypothetical protein